MNTFLMPPHPEGSLQQQMQRQYAYLCQMAQQLNLALQQLGGADSLDGRGGQDVVTPAVRPAATDEEKRQYEEACKVWQEECVRAEIKFERRTDNEERSDVYLSRGRSR